MAFLRDHHRPLITLMAYIALAFSVLAITGTAQATHLPDVVIYDSASCSGTAFHAKQSYNNLGSIGWGDRISAFDATSNSAPGFLARDDNYAGNRFNFGTNGADCNLSNNDLWWGPINVTWSNQASSLGEQ